MTLKHFSIPCDNITRLFSESRLRSQVVVVSIIGKTASEDIPAFEFPSVLDDIDELMRTLGAQNSAFNGEIGNFDSFFDPDENVVYVSLIRPSDNAIQNFSSNESVKNKIENQGFLNYWSNAKIAFARALLFLFSISHIILFVSPGYSLDVKTIQLFKVLSYVRHKYQGTIAKILGRCREVSEDWANHGRLCSPRIIFLFKGIPYEIYKVEQKNERIAKIKKLEHSLEDQIYVAFRQSRVVKDVCNRTLFSIAPNDEFVFVGLHTEKKVPKHQPDDFFERIENEYAARLDARLPLGAISSCDFVHKTTDEFSSDLSQSDSEDSLANEEIFETRESSQMLRHSLKELIMRHVRKAHTGGFNDNIGKFSNIKTFFEVPTLQTWLLAINAVLNNPESGLKETNNTAISLEKLLGTEMKFSNTRCKKVLPLALAVYQESLPSHYNQMTHEKQLKRAIAVFAHHARGPAQQVFIEQLKDECERIWKNGRQTCEALSLNKNPCTKPKHLSSSSHLLPQLGFCHPEMESLSTSVLLSNLPLMFTSHLNLPQQFSMIIRESDHWSGIQFYSSCNCGTKQGPRQDPFTLRAANYDFYQIIGQECGCIHSEKINFPVFQPSISDYREADLNNPSQSIDHKKCIPIDTNLGENSPLSTSIEKHSVRHISTTEYLPGMIHLESPLEFLPLFSSWSLLCRGPSSLYSHNVGLHDFPGFIHGSSYLLPWDVSFREKDICKSEPPENFKKSSLHNGMQILKPGNRRNQRMTKEFMSVKIFIGVEYECVRGHRFMSSAPGVIVKATGATLKEDAHKVTEGNMPLYLPCPCGKVIAQLMRVHIVTPKAPVYVTIDPKVRPAPPPCPIFITGEHKPIPLSQSAYWVLRLPYVYASEKKVYSMPTRMKNFKYGELLGPMYGITQADV